MLSQLDSNTCTDNNKTLITWRSPTILASEDHYCLGHDGSRGRDGSRECDGCCCHDGELALLVYDGPMIRVESLSMISDQLSDEGCLFVAGAARDMSSTVSSCISRKVPREAKLRFPHD